MTRAVDHSTINTGELLSRARKLETALESGQIKVAYQSEIQQINKAFIDVLEKHPVGTVGELKGALETKIQSDGRLKKAMEITSWAGIGLVLGAMAYTAATGGAGLPVALVQLAGVFGFLGGMGGRGTRRRAWPKARRSTRGLMSGLLRFNSRRSTASRSRSYRPGTELRLYRKTPHSHGVVVSWMSHAHCAAGQP